MTDSQEEAGGDGWVTVGDAAEQSGLSTATIRQLYRSGAIASRRRNGTGGPYLVVLEEVMSHMPEPSEEMDAAYWEDEAKRARAETAALRAELERVRAERDELQVAVDILREKAARPPVRVPLSGPPPRLRSEPTPAADPASAETPEPDSTPEPTPEPEPARAADAPNRRSRPREAAEDVVVPAPAGRRGLLKRRRD